MRDHEWKLIEPGDFLHYLPVPTEKNPKPAPMPYQVYKFEEGTGVVLAVRFIENKDDGVATFTTTETVRLSKNSDRWVYVSCKAKIAATGGFLVTRANGDTEYDECPTERTKAMGKQS